MIPKKLFTVWLGPDPRPEASDAFLRAAQQMHSKWEVHHLVSEDAMRIVVSFSKALFERFEAAGDWSNKSNILRYALLWRYGGFYIDHDVQLIRPLDDLLVHHVVVGIENGSNMVGTAVMGAETQCPFIGHLIMQIVEGKTGSNGRYGPCFLTEVLNDWHAKHSIKVLPQRVFFPLPYENRGDGHGIVYPETYAIHYWNHSWA